jgi:hypothetical protein
MWTFVLQAWQIRNETEHNKKGDPIKRQKQKLVSSEEHYGRRCYGIAIRKYRDDGYTNKY